MIGVWKEPTNRDIKSPLSDTKSFDFRKPLEKFEKEITPESVKLSKVQNGARAPKTHQPRRCFC